MSTPVTIDPDVEVLLKKAANEQRKTLTEVLNNVLRQALVRAATRQRKLYVLTPRHLGIRADANLDKAHQLADELEDQEIIRKLRGGR